MGIVKSISDAGFVLLHEGSANVRTSVLHLVVGGAAK